MVSFFSGNPKTAATLVEQAELEWCMKESGGSNWGRIRSPIKETGDLKDIQAAPDADAVNMEELFAAIPTIAKYCISILSKLQPPHTRSRKEPDGATVRPRPFTKPIFAAKKWVQGRGSNLSLLPSTRLLDRLHTFASHRLLWGLTAWT